MPKRTLILLILSLLTIACSGGEGGAVEVRWQAETPAVRLAENNHGFEASPTRTMVHVTNRTDRLLRDATLHFSERQAESIAGLSLGTVTNRSTSFYGADRVWRLGDLPPGASVPFYLGLWITAEYGPAAPDTLDLAIELWSPDLPTAIRTTLSIALEPSAKSR